MEHFDSTFYEHPREKRMPMAHRWVLLSTHEDNAMLCARINNLTNSPTEARQRSHSFIRDATTDVELIGIRVPSQLVT